jgi:hypothetical protein
VVKHGGAKFRNLFLPQEFHFHKEAVKAKRRHAQDKHKHDYKLHRMLAETVIRLAIRELPTDNRAYEKRQEY